MIYFIINLKNNIKFSHFYLRSCLQVHLPRYPWSSECWQRLGNIEALSQQPTEGARLHHSHELTPMNGTCYNNILVDNSSLRYFSQILLVCVNKSSPSQRPFCNLPSFAMQTAFPYDQIQCDNYLSGAIYEPALCYSSSLELPPCTRSFFQFS